MAPTQAAAAQRLFKVLRTSTNFDPRFDELMFGICDRRQPVAKFIQSASGFPLLVPMSLLVRVLPSIFDVNGGVVRYAPAWEKARRMIGDFVAETYNVVLEEDVMACVLCV